MEHGEYYKIERPSREITVLFLADGKLVEKIGRFGCRGKMNMKKIVLFLIVVSLIITSQKEIASAKAFPTARETVDAIGVGWNLGNSLDCNGEWIEKYTANKPEDYEKAWGNPLTTQKMIDAVKAAGFDAIRVPVTWERHMDETGKVDPAWMARVKEIVDYVIKDDLYCIINVHHDAGAVYFL